MTSSIPTCLVPRNWCEVDSIAPHHTSWEGTICQTQHHMWAESVVGFPPRVYFWLVHFLNFNFNLKTMNREAVPRSDDPELQQITLVYKILIFMVLCLHCFYCSWNPTKHIASQVVVEKYIKSDLLRISIENTLNRTLVCFNGLHQGEFCSSHCAWKRQEP